MKGRYEGSVTVYFSVVTLLLIALIASLIEGARYSCLRVRVYQATEAAAESLMACYDTELFNQYGLIYYRDSNQLVTNILLDGFFQPEADADAGRLIKHVQLLKISDATINIVKRCRATDDCGENFVDQVLELMKYVSVAEIAQTVKDMIKGKETSTSSLELADSGQADYESTDWQQRADELNSVEGDGEATEPVDNGNVNQDLEQTVNESLIGYMENLLGQAVLGLALPGKKISGNSVANYFLWEINSEIGRELSFEEQILFGEYILSYFGNVVSPSGGPLAYEQEYILNGFSSDAFNLSLTLGEVFALRSGLDLMSILSYKALRSQASSLANVLVGWLCIPALTRAVEMMICAAWATGEAVLDIRALANGKKIPFFKTSKTFDSTLADCVVRVAGGEAAGESDKGIGYEMYIRMFLALAGNRVVERTMQVIELNMRKDDMVFSFKDLLYGFTVMTDGKMKPLFSSAYNWLYRGAGKYNLVAEVTVAY